MNRKINISQEDKNKAYKFLGAVILLYLGNKMISAIRKNASDNQMDTSPEAGQAVTLRQAINPSGNWWMRRFDGTDKEAIWSIAGDIKDMDKVKNHFKAQTEGGDLYEELQAALSPDEYQKFLSLASKGKTGSWYYADKQPDKVPANNWVITKLPANVRSSPENIHYLRIWNENIVKKAVPKGMILGISTGKFKYDEANKVLFVEFYTFTVKHGKQIYYVAKSQVELVPDAEKKKKELQSKIPLQVIEGVFESTEPQESTRSLKIVITTDPCYVFNENFEKMGIVRRNVTIGYPIMTLDTGKEKYIKVKTIQGLLRWISADSATVRDNPELNT
jgi:hypothetical protein